MDVLGGRHSSALLIQIGREFDGFVGAVKPLELTNSKGEVVPMGLSHVIHFVVAQVHAARSNFVQLGFPDVGAIFIDQRDERALTSAMAVSQPRREFQTASATSHDDNFVLFAHFHARDQVAHFSPGNPAT